MKCIKNTDGEIRRVRDDHAATQVKSGDWMYIPKSEWKEATRPSKEKDTKSNGNV